MATTYEDLARVNQNLSTMPIKGKEYVQVNERIKAFRMLHPEGSIVTEIISHADGMIVMRATVTTAEGVVLATGTAFECQSSSYINKTSYIENCETSAVGRALGNAGFGINASVCSADELVGALAAQQGMKEQEETAKVADEKRDPWQVARVKEFTKAHGITSPQMGAFKKMAIKEGIVPDKSWTELNEEELTKLFRFVEMHANAGEA